MEDFLCEEKQKKALNWIKCTAICKKFYLHLPHDKIVQDIEIFVTWDKFNFDNLKFHFGFLLRILLGLRVNLHALFAHLQIFLSGKA
jgi:hypothetical protein